MLRSRWLPEAWLADATGFIPAALPNYSLINWFLHTELEQPWERIWKRKDQMLRTYPWIRKPPSISYSPEEDRILVSVTVDHEGERWASVSDTGRTSWLLAFCDDLPSQVQASLGPDSGPLHWASSMGLPLLEFDKNLHLKILFTLPDSSPLGQWENGKLKVEGSQI